MVCQVPFNLQILISDPFYNYYIIEKPSVLTLIINVAISFRRSLKTLSISSIQTSPKQNPSGLESERLSNLMELG